MKPSYTLPHGLLLAYVLLTFGCLGAAVVAELAELRNAADVSSYLSAADLAAWQMASTDRTALLLTVLSGVQTAALLALVWWLPAAVPRGVLWAALACHLVVWLIGLLTRLPLSSFTGADLGLVNLLVHSDWVRKLVLLIEAPLAAYMTFRAFWPAASGKRVIVPGKTPALG